MLMFFTETVNLTDEKFYVDKVEFDGEEVKDFRVPVEKVMQGGTLRFYMK